MRNRIAAIAATIIALSGIVGIGFAYAATTVNVPNNGSQLTGTVYICVDTANEGRQYVELGHPAPGNCASGYLQYTANQPSSTTVTTTPGTLVNSESFDYGTANSNTSGCSGANGTTAFCVSLPAGTHVTNVVSVVDENSSTATPIPNGTATITNSVTGQIAVAWPPSPANQPVATNQIQITYDYSS